MNLSKYGSAPEVCQYLSTNRRGLRKLMKKGLPFIRLGERSQLFDWAEVEKWLNDRRTER